MRLEVCSMGSDDVDVRSSDSAGDDDVLAYVRDDVAREYARVLPDEQMSM